MHEERRKILEMLAQGRLSADEADRQLEALARSAARPVIDVEPERGRWERYWRWGRGLQNRLRDRRNWPGVVLVAPLAVLLVLGAVALILLALLAVAAFWLAVPAVVLYAVWNGLLAAIVPGLPPMGWFEAFILALVVMILLQGRRQWRP